MTSRALAAALALAVLPLAAVAEPAGKRVGSVQVLGNRRTEADAVLGVVRTKAGKPLDAETVTEDIRRIYTLRTFDDVQVEAEEGPEGLLVTYRVTEKPSVHEVRFEGNDELSEEDLKEVVNIQPFSMLSVAEVKRNARKIRELYTEKGYFLADVEHETVPKGKHEVDVVFRINEQAKVQVRKITFLGNKAFPDKELSEAMATKEGGLLSFITQAGNFKQEEFDRDILRLNGFYYDRGHVNVKVGRPRVALSPDRTGLYITIPIEEGVPFDIGKIDVKGDLLGDPEEILDLLTVETGETFNRSKLFKDLTRVGDWYKDKGYAYANVTPLTRSDDDERKIGITVDIQKGKIVKFGRIEVRGNLRTRDKVVRRELRIYEGAQYSSTKLAESKRNITRLGYFERVELTPRRGAADDRMDVIVEVKERHTGTFQLGAGFSSVEAFILTGQVSQHNLFGRGQTLSFQGTLSGIRQQLNLSFTEPHFLDTDWLFAFDLFRFELDFIDFLRKSSGGDITLGYRLTDEVSASFTYEHAYVDWTFRDAPNRSEAGLTSSIKGTLTYDSRDNRLFPTDGYFHMGSVEWADDSAPLFSDNQFTRVRYNSRFYHPLFWGLVFKASARYGVVLPTGGEPVPTFERFFVGGINSVRGFNRNSLGPVARLGAVVPEDPLLLVHAGGEEELIFNFELEFPIFEQVGIRGVVFTDFGEAFCGQVGCSALDPDLETGSTLWGDQLSSLASLRRSWGFGFRWFSPIGPLRFEWGFPFSPRAGEDDDVFEFTIGNFL